MTKVYDRVKEIIIRELKVDEEKVVPNASFADDLEADSLDMVQLVMAFEEEFSVNGNQMEIKDEDAENIRTVQDAVDFVLGKGITDAVLS